MINSESNVSYNPKGYIEVTVVGRVNLELSEELGLKTLDLAIALGDENRPILILINSTKSKGWDKNVINYLRAMFKDVNYKKLATFGASKKVSALQKILITSIGLRNKVKTFSTKAEAEAWLLDDENLTSKD